MSQDNPEAGDVFVIPDKSAPIVYLLIRRNSASDILDGLWFTHSGIPTIRPSGGFPRDKDTFVCNITKLLRIIEMKLVDAATNS